MTHSESLATSCRGEVKPPVLLSFFSALHATSELRCFWYLSLNIRIPYEVTFLFKTYCSVLVKRGDHTIEAMKELRKLHSNLVHFFVKRNKVVGKSYPILLISVHNFVHLALLLNW